MSAGMSNPAYAAKIVAALDETGAPMAAKEGEVLWTPLTGVSNVALIKGNDRREITYEALKKIEADIWGAIGEKKKILIKPNFVTTDVPLCATHVDAVRAILDGHVVLDRRRVHAGMFPAVDPLASLSRLAPKLLAPDQLEAVTKIRAALAAYEEVKDLVEIGAYQRGSNPLADAAMDVKPALDAFLRQVGGEDADLADSWGRAFELARHLP